jgi:hypothetical protein
MVVGVEPTVPFHDALYQQLYRDTSLGAVTVRAARAHTSRSMPCCWLAWAVYCHRALER